MSAVFAKTHEPFNYTVGDAAPAYLNRLRLNGFSRFTRYASAVELKKRDPWEYSYSSGAFHWLWLDQGPRKGIYLDLGCGMSADVIAAASLGYTSYGLDLFSLVYPGPGWHVYRSFKQLTDRLIIADIGIHIPFSDNSVFAASSYAAIDLLRPEKRLKCYQEAFRVLRPGSIFALAGVSLANGWGWNRNVELERARSVGFELAFPATQGFKLRKPESSK